MEIAIIEIVLWLGFGLLIWALRESLNGVEIELHGPPPAARAKVPLPPASRPQQLFEPIGRYADRIIHEFAVIDGRGYRFESVCPRREARRIEGHQRWVAPGLVYAECALPPELLAKQRIQ
jgi:hypothetical protein